MFTHFYNPLVKIPLVYQMKSPSDLSRVKLSFRKSMYQYNPTLFPSKANLITNAIRGKEGSQFHVHPPRVLHLSKGKKWSRVPVPPPLCFVTRSPDVSIRAAVNGWKGLLPPLNPRRTLQRIVSFPPPYERLGRMLGSAKEMYGHC
ncbi:hypothetical protein CEXT_218971 [Caerostris extrusa]|uniref:Uncharacterized protein n=1 Tax=Caerostris extrusa TaxID=172846 RepID=A0AAV4WXN9_CAEEX|nr:hypothetical protein CEXT_218971 [Caerostris extrusa]